MREGTLTPKMENGKCMENCTWKDEYGFCTNGDDCIKYGCNNVTGRPLREENHLDGSEDKDITLREVQNMLGKAMRDLMNKNLSAKERQEARDTARELSALAKQLMTGFDLTLEAYGLLASRGIDTRGVRGMLE